MAKDIATKKRKASVPETEIEKVKKVKKAVSEGPEVTVKKRKATEETAPPAIKKSKTPKSTEDAQAPKAKPTKKAAESTNGNAPPTKTSKATKKDITAAKKLNGAAAAKNAKRTMSNDRISLSDDDEDKQVEDEAEDSDVDDQTEALLKGFESEGDDHDAKNDDGLQEGQSVPDVPELTKENQKKLKRSKDSDEKPGVVYVGRIPHGFYENEMKAYFKQFGTILKLRLSRNRKTGASKHFAFIQFESATVADIVAKTMDNYLLFGHILKVKMIPNEQVPENVFKGANKRFKKVPWNKLEGRKLEQGQSEEAWDLKAEKEETKRAKKVEKMKEIGYEFEAPKVKSAKGVAARKVITNGDAETETKPIEAAPVTEEAEKPKAKKAKKAKKSKTEETLDITANGADDASVKKVEAEKSMVEETADITAIDGAADVSMKKVKSKKLKTALAEEPAMTEEVVKKVRAKKSKAALVQEPAVTEEVVKKVRAKKSKADLVEEPAVAEEVVKKAKKAEKVKKVGA